MTTLGSSFNCGDGSSPTNARIHRRVVHISRRPQSRPRCTRIEIYALEAQGLVLLHDVPLYCRVATMEL